MNLISTELNERLAASVRHLVDSERFYINGKASFWRLVGIGLLVFGIGTSFGLGFFGYSYISDRSYSFENFSSSLTSALAEVQLKATAQGIVQIEPKEIALASGQLISLDPSSRIAIDPTSRIRADGEIVVQSPSVSGPRSGTTQQQIPNITNFTVFKGVKFEKGSVQTGWIFLTSAQRFPTRQYCYYSEASDSTPGRNVSLDIGLDEKPETPKAVPKDFDLAAAFGRCVWFRRDAQ